MSNERLTRILALLDRIGAGHLCEVAARATAVTGAGIMLLAGETSRGTVCATDDVAAHVADLQYTLGEGPSIDAHRSGFSVSEPDLEGLGVTRWTAFAPRAAASGARAVFGYPLRVGAARLGALGLYGEHPGALSDDQQADALVMADVAALAILSMQADAPPDQIAAEIEAGSDFQFVVHQATGMISVQAEISVAEALIRLRAHAFRTDRLASEVATDVVERRLRFDVTGAD